MSRFLTAAALIAASTCIALGVGDAVLRLMFVSPQPQFMQIDAELGHGHRALVSGYQTREGLAHVSINSFGMRDDEYALEKSAKKRIAILGDSYAEAFQVELAETYHGLLESEFGDQAEVLNFGVGGYGTAQQLMVYEQLARQFKPDLVVLALYPGNDFQENSKPLSGGYPRPYFRRVNNQLIRDDGFRESAKLRRPQWIYDAYYFLTDHSLLFSLLDQLRYRVLREDAAQRGIAGPGLESGSNILYAPSSPDHLEAWALTERLILAVADAVHADGAKFILFVQDSLPAQSVTKLDRFHVENRLGRLCSENQLDCVFMGPVALAFGEINRVDLHGFGGNGIGHWNPTGHRIARDVLRGALLRSGFLQAEGLRGQDAPAH